MSALRIALCQTNATVGALKENAEKILRFTERARDCRADLICFPELAITGYPPRDLLERDSFIHATELAIRTIARRSNDATLLFGAPERDKTAAVRTIYNSACLVSRTRHRYVHRKLLLPSYDVFDENRYFRAGHRTRVLRWKGFRIGITVCEDIWNDEHATDDRLYSQNPIGSIARAGADLIINLSASPFDAEKIRFRERMLRKIARTYRTPVFYVNTVGGADQLIFDGGSLVADARGRICARGAYFKEDFLIVEVAHRSLQKRPRMSRNTRGLELTLITDARSRDTEATLLPARRKRLPGQVSSNRPARASKRAALPTPLALTWNALVLGIRDYFRKCGFRSAVLGLSGGIDSSLVAALAVEALGSRAVTGVLMPSPYTSRASMEDAAALAENLQVRTHTVSITSIFELFLRELQPIIGGMKADQTEENLQARIRGTTLMAFSNKHGALVLATGNKSELSMGYCTLYGDMTGGLSVIGDVYKTRVFELCRYLNEREGRALIPQRVLVKPPSAELRPNQKDEDSLPPYAILDPILHDIIERGQSRDALLRKWRRKFDAVLLASIYDRYARAEYKRQQAPPILRVTQKAFGVGRRFLISARNEY